MTRTIRGTVREVNRYADGTPALEIHVPRDRAEGLPFQLGIRVPITLRLGRAEYEAGLRATARNEYVWVSPDLRTSDGSRTTLGHILTSGGIERNSEVMLVIAGHAISVEFVTSSPASADPRPRSIHRERRSLASANSAEIEGLSMVSADRTTRDPLANLDWSTIYDRYDTKCVGFRPDSNHLRALSPRPASDRALYYRIAQLARQALLDSETLSAEAYEAMLYWKLYSQPAAAANIKKWLAPDKRAIVEGALVRLVAKLPRSILRNCSAIRDLLAIMDTVRLI